MNNRTCYTENYRKLVGAGGGELKIVLIVRFRLRVKVIRIFYGGVLFDSFF